MYTIRSLEGTDAASPLIRAALWPVRSRLPPAAVAAAVGFASFSKSILVCAGRLRHAFHSAICQITIKLSGPKSPCLALSVPRFAIRTRRLRGQHVEIVVQSQNGVAAAGRIVCGYATAFMPQLNPDWRKTLALHQSACFKGAEYEFVRTLHNPDCSRWGGQVVWRQLHASATSCSRCSRSPRNRANNPLAAGNYALLVVRRSRSSNCDFKPAPSTACGPGTQWFLRKSANLPP